MNAEVIKANKAAFDFGLNGGKIWTKDYEYGEKWFLHKFCCLTFDRQELVYVPDDENAEMVKAYLDGKGKLEYKNISGNWCPSNLYPEKILKDGLNTSEYVRGYRLKPQKPRATKEQTYYYIADDLRVSFHLELNDGVDERFYKSGNYFRTKEQAEKVLAKLQQAIEEVHNETKVEK